MWFNVLSLLIALICFVKAGTALLAPDTFYNRRRQQYASAAVPRSVLVVPMLMLMLTGIAWYAALYHYVDWSWLVTGFLSATSLLALVNICRWPAHRVKLLAAIGEEHAERRTYVDVGMLGLGSVFGVLGVIL